MAVCGKCSNNIVIAKEVLTCAECSLVFHPTCTRVETLENFKKLGVQRKSTWKCDGCSTPSRGDVDCSALATMLQNMDKNLCAQIGMVSTNLESVKSELGCVNTSVTQMRDTLSMLAQENEKRKEEYAELTKKNEEMQREMGDLRARVRDLEQYSRRNNVEIVGVPYESGENVSSLLEQIADLIKVKFQRSEISTAHRLQVTEERPNPSIIVSFVCRDYKHLWTSAAREHRRRLNGAELRDSWQSRPIYVNDHLTPYNRAILGKAKRLVREQKIFRAWTRDCRVYVRRTSDPQCRSTPVHTVEDLENIVQV